MKKIILFLSLFFTSQAYAAQPILYCSDLESGPNSGGLNNKGAFVTIWGLNFGASQGVSYVTIGDGAADNYISWADDKIEFQLGSSAATGYIKVHTSGGWNYTYYDKYGTGYAGLPFTVRAGNIYFVDISQGTNGDGSYASPWNTFGVEGGASAAYQALDAGDICYFRTGTLTDHYGDISDQDAVIDFQASDYNWANGTSANPIALVAYPGETVTLSAPDSVGVTGGIDGHYASGLPPYMVIAKINFVTWGTSISTGGATTAGGGYNPRIVGCDIDGLNTTSVAQSGIISLGRSATILKNNIHGGRTNNHYDHAIYFSGCATDNDSEVGYSYIYDNNFDYGVWVANNHESTRCGVGEYQKDVYFHHTKIDTTVGMNNQSTSFGVFHMGFNTGTDSTDFVPNTFFWSNLVIGGGVDNGQIFYGYNGRIYVENNTFYGFTSSDSIGSLYVADHYAVSDVDLYHFELNNNIFRTTSGTYKPYGIWNGTPDVGGSVAVVASNLSYGSGLTVTGDNGWNDSNPINSDPTFVNAPSDLSLSDGSPAIDEGTTSVQTCNKTDFYGYPWGVTRDIGAIQYGTGESTPAKGIFGTATFSNATIR